MTIFDLHQRILGDYHDFVHSFIQIADDRVRAFVDTELRQWPRREAGNRLLPARRQAISLQKGQDSLHVSLP